MRAVVDETESARTLADSKAWPPCQI